MPIVNLGETVKVMLILPDGKEMFTGIQVLPVNQASVESETIKLLAIDINGNSY